MNNISEIQFKELLFAPPEYGANASAIEFNGNDPRYLRITDISEDGTLLHDDIKAIPRYIAEAYILQKDEITIARTGNTVGKAYLYKEEDGEIAYAGYLIRFKIDYKKADPVFVFQFLHSPYYYSWIERTLRTGAQPNINAAEYCSMLLPDFGLNQQKIIAKILTTIDQLIEKTQALIDKHTAIKQGMMADFFTRGIDLTTGQLRPPLEQAPYLYKETELGWVPKGWDVRELSEIATVIDSLHQTPSFYETGLAMVRVTDIKGGMLDLTECVKVNNSIFTQFTSSYTPKKGDIALSRVGSYGISSYADTDEPFCMGQNTVVISTANNSRYLYELLQSRIVRNQFDLSVAGSSQKTLSLKAIKSTYIPCPLNAEKQVITDRCVAVYGNTEKESITLNKYKSIKKGLMQDLLTGKVSV